MAGADLVMQAAAPPAADDMAGSAPAPTDAGMTDAFDAPAPEPAPEPQPEAPMDDFSSDMNTVDTMDSSLNSLSDDL
jgi:hypothetical protein